MFAEHVTNVRLYSKFIRPCARVVVTSDAGFVLASRTSSPDIPNLLLSNQSYSAKLDKYPDGYPGDAEPPDERPHRVWKKPRMRVRYFCHKCDTFYAPGENICASCGEEKGPNSRRDPYVLSSLLGRLITNELYRPKKKEKPPIDEELLRRVRERLQEFQLASDP